MTFLSDNWSTEDDLLTISHDLAGTANDNAFTTDTYTPAHQIASSAISNPAYQYTTPIAGTAGYTTNGLNEYSSITPVGGSAIAPGYDTNGNLNSDGNFFFGYDPENRLMTATKSGTAVTYAYDPLDRRTTKTVNGTATYFVHSDADEIGEYDGSGNLLRRYVPSGAVDEPIAMVTSAGTKTFFHQDKTDSVVAMSDVNGNLTEGPYTYDAYGNGAPATGVPFKYTGQRLDPETGLYYYRARYYSSALGRFLQTDSIGYADDIDWYNYTGEDPTDKNDPTGKCPECVTAAIGAGVGGLWGGGFEIVRQIGTTGHVSDWGSVGTAALGGAVAGGVTGFTGCISCGNAAGGFVQSGADSLRQDPHNIKAAMLNGAIGGGASVIAGKMIPGASGNSIAKNEAVVKMITTKIANGTIRRISAKTAGRFVTSTITKNAAPTMIGRAAQDMVTSQSRVKRALCTGGTATPSGC